MLQIEKKLKWNSEQQQNDQSRKRPVMKEWLCAKHAKDVIHCNRQDMLTGAQKKAAPVHLVGFRSKNVNTH